MNSFKIEDKVLKSKIEIGRLNVHELNEKYEGSYEVNKVWGNGVTYALQRVEETVVCMERGPLFIY